MTWAATFSAAATPLSVAGAAVTPSARFEYLHPGKLCVAEHPSAVTTILGSCVAVCLWDRRRAIGGVNHFLLPFHAGHGAASLRFGDVAVVRLRDALAALGAGGLEAKSFGGASVLGNASRADHLGAKNVALARRLLAEARIAVVAEDVGGTRGRKLIFHTADGTARVKAL